MTAPAFNPELTVTEAPRHGRRRRPDSVRGAPLNWPEDMAERRSAVRAWRKMAARIVNEERLSFRLLAVLPDQIIWSSGQVRASNSRLADEAGGCSEKTIQRDVELLRLRGLIVREPSHPDARITHSKSFDAARGIAEAINRASKAIKGA